MIRIAKVIGTEDVMSYVKKYDHVTLSAYFKEHLLNFKKKPWDKFVNTQNMEMVCPTHGYDLLTKMLTIDHVDRITASEAIAHPFFDSIREEEA